MGTVAKLCFVQTVDFLIILLKKKWSRLASFYLASVCSNQATKFLVETNVPMTLLHQNLVRQVHLYNQVIYLNIEIKELGTWKNMNVETTRNNISIIMAAIS